MAVERATRVSVIVPVFNRERYVEQCLDSILATRYPELEILVVDDGSTDSTPAILEDVRARAGGMVRVLHHPGRQNRGPSSSRNLALARAAGAYVCFLDSDDVRPANKRSEDFHLWLRMLACGRFAVGSIDRPVTLYRRHGENVWTPHGRDGIRDLGVLADVLAWARRSPFVPTANAMVLREAYRRKARRCLAMLRAERDRRALIALARSLLAVDRSWLRDGGFLANVIRGLVDRSIGPRGKKAAR